MALTRKWFYISIFTTNHFRVRRAKREIERERKKRSLNSLHSHRSSPSPHLRSPSSLTHTELSHSILSLTVVRSRWVFCLQLISSSVRRRLFMGLTVLHLRSTHLTSDLHSSDITSPHLTNLLDHQLLSRRSAWSLWSLIFLLLLWWCGWWRFGGFCFLWWWVSWSGGFSMGVGVWWWWFSDIKFVWKLRKWLRKYEKFVGKLHFQNITKHWKLFSNIICKMQPNTGKYFHFLKIFYT